MDQCVLQFATSQQVNYAPNYNYKLCFQACSRLYSFYAVPISGKLSHDRAVVVTQLVEQVPPIPDVLSSNQVIGKFILNICLLSTVLKRGK